MLGDLGILFEGDVLHVAHSVPEHWPRWYTTVGRRATAYCTSLGKMLLSERPWEEVQALVAQQGWHPCTARSIQDFDTLEAELAATRERGYAIDNEERNPGTVCIGAPIRDYSGEVIAALSVSGKVDKLTEEFRARNVPRVREAADRISFRLGYHSSSAYL